MIKAVVAEDQPLILRNIKRQIEAYSNEVKVIGEAIDGQMALKMVKEFKPEIVFTDIRMPVMDGLQFITEAKSASPGTRFIIISGFAEFEYARQALKLNVSEYLLKPVSEKDIHQVLEKMIKVIKIQNEEHEFHILTDILNKKSLPPVSNNLSYNTFSVFLLCAGGYSNFIIDYENPFNTFWSEIDFESILSLDVPQNIKFWCFDGKNLNEKVVIFGFRDCEPNIIDFLPNKLINDLSRYNIPINIVASFFIQDIKNLGIEHQSIREVLRKNLIFGKSNFFIKHELRINPVERLSVIDHILEKKLFNYIQNNQKNLFYEEILNLIKNWKKTAILSIHLKSCSNRLVNFFKNLP